MIVIAGQIKVNEEQRGIAVVDAMELAKLSSDEEGCIRYEFYVGISDPNTLFFFEQWETQEAFDRHKQAEHTQTIVARLTEYAPKGLEVTRFIADEQVAS